MRNMQGKPRENDPFFLARKNVSTPPHTYTHLPQRLRIFLEEIKIRTRCRPGMLASSPECACQQQTQCILPQGQNSFSDSKFTRFVGFTDGSFPDGSACPDSEAMRAFIPILIANNTGHIFQKMSLLLCLCVLYGCVCHHVPECACVCTRMQGRN